MSKDNLLTQPDPSLMTRLPHLIEDYVYFDETAQLVSQIESFKSKFTKENKTHIGSFYKCRKMGIVTKYDQNLYESCNSSCVMTLFYSLFAPKILTTSLINLGYFDKKKEFGYILLGTMFSVFVAIVVCYKKKSTLDQTLDRKYTEVYVTTSSKLGVNKI